MITAAQLADGQDALPLGQGRSVWRQRSAIAAVVILYLGFGVLSNLPSWTGGVTHTMQCGGCGDSGQEVWFLAWGAHALTHLLDPIRSNFLNYPWGVDLADNTSMPLAGAIATPITLLFGPITTFNVVFSLAFAGSATAMFFVLRRFTTWMVAAFIGGLLYGFCPYMVGQGEGHIFLMLAAVPPVMLLLLDEIIVRQRGRWWIMGLLLGLVMIIQLGWSAELLACLLLVAAIGIVVLAIGRRHLIASHFAYAVKAIVLGVVVLAPFGLWFALVSRTGPEHITGPVHSVAALAGLSSDLAGLVIPTVNQHFSFGLAQTGTSFVHLLGTAGVTQPDATEDGTYVGIPILLLLAIGSVRFWREGIVRFSMLMAGLTLLVSMGSRLRVWGHVTIIRLPFVVLTHLPFLQSEVASRYCLFMWLFIALAVAVMLDRARAVGLAPGRLHGRGSGKRFAYSPLPILLVLAVLGLVSLVPGWPYNIGQVYTPPALVPPTVVSNIAGGTLLTYPMARNVHNLPMVWQSIDGFNYRIPAGEASVANGHYGATEAAFSTCWQVTSTLEYAPPASFLPAARSDFVRWQVRAVVIPLRSSVNPLCAVRFVQAVLGRAPVYEQDAAVWTNVELPRS